MQRKDSATTRQTGGSDDYPAPEETALPTVFSTTEAWLSALGIATIGACTLTVRWYFENLVE